jgi:hypothetical protein
VRKDRIQGIWHSTLRGNILWGRGKKLGFIDNGEASLWSAGREIHSEHKLKGDFQLLYIKQPKKGFSLSSFLENFEESAETLKQHLSFENRGALPLLLYKGPAE